MDFPAQPPRPCEVPPTLAQALGTTPVEVLASEDYVVVLAKEEAVVATEPDFDRLKELDLGDGRRHPGRFRLPLFRAQTRGG